MREETRRSAVQLRFLAIVALIVGIIICALIVVPGITAIREYRNNITISYTHPSVLDSMKQTRFYGKLIYGIGTAFAGYVGFVLFGALATIIENLDKTSTKAAIDKLTYATALLGKNIKPENDKNEIISDEQANKKE